MDPQAAQTLKKINWKMLLIVLVIGLLALGVAWWYLNNYYKVETQNTVKNPTNGREVTISAKKYTSSTDNMYNSSPKVEFKDKVATRSVKAISFKYPKPFFLTRLFRDIENPPSGGVPDWVVAKKRIKKISEYKALKSCLIVDSDLVPSSPKDALEVQGGFIGFGKSEVVSSESFVVNGVIGIVREIVPEEKREEVLEAAFVKNGVSIYFRSCSKDDAQLFDIILPTLKFL